MPVTREGLSLFHMVPQSSNDPSVYLHHSYSWFQTFAMFWILYVFLWVIPQRLNFICRRFGTFCLFHFHRQIGVEWLCLRNVGVFTGKKAWLENGLSHPPFYWLRPFLIQAFFPVNTPTFLKHSHSKPTRLWRWNRHSVPKRRHIKFGRRGITQKKTYYIIVDDSLLYATITYCDFHGFQAP